MNSEESLRQTSASLRGIGRTGPAPSIPRPGLQLDRVLPSRVADALFGAFGGGLQQVRVQADEAAGNAAANINARAFSIGRDIYMGPDEFDPGSVSGVGLLAHEIAHVLQPGSRSGLDVQRQPRTTREDVRHAGEPYPEEQAILRTAIETAQVGGLVPGKTLVDGHPKARVLAGDAIMVGPFTSDMGPIYYVYRFGGLDEQNKTLVSRSSVIPADWAEGPTSLELDRAQGATVLHVSTAARTGRRRDLSKQQLWEREFERDYPHLRNVGGGGDPWGETDEGEMTATGVRVPRDAGHTLLRRPFYEHRLAAFFAYQGFIHYAELLEAGQGKAALLIAQTLYARTGQQIPKDSDLDLWAQTKWSRKAATARQTVEFGVLASEVAMAAGRLWSIMRRPRPVVAAPTPDAPTPSATPTPTPTPISGPPLLSPAAVRRQITTSAETIVAQSNAAVERAVRSQDRAFFQGLGMSQSQIRKVMDPTHRMFKAEYGNAMERATARAFTQDPLLSQSVRHIGSQRGHVAGTGKPDFVIDAGAWGQTQFMDVTTRGARAAHVLRDYGKRVLQLVYDIPTFP